MREGGAAQAHIIIIIIIVISVFLMVINMCVYIYIYIYIERERASDSQNAATGRGQLDSLIALSQIPTHLAGATEARSCPRSSSYYP